MLYGGYEVGYYFMLSQANCLDMQQCGATGGYLILLMCAKADYILLVNVALFCNFAGCTSKMVTSALLYDKLIQ